MEGEKLTVDFKEDPTIAPAITVPDLQRSRCSIILCYGPRAFRGPALLLRFFYKSKTN